MSDNTRQELKAKFNSMVKSGIDNIFDKPLPEIEADKVIVDEIGDLLGKMTVMNNLSADLIEDTRETMEALDTADKSIADLKRQMEIRKDLDIAA
jgi:hypothetical protein